MNADWRFSAGLSAIALIVVLVVVPIVAGDNLVLRSVAPVARAFGLLFAAVFALIAAGKFLLGEEDHCTA